MSISAFVGTNVAVPWSSSLALKRRRAEVSSVSTGFFDALRIPTIEGRAAALSPELPFQQSCPTSAHDRRQDL